MHELLIQITQQTNRLYCTSMHYYELVIECAIAVYAVYCYFLLFGPSFELAP